MADIAFCTKAGFRMISRVSESSRMGSDGCAFSDGVVFHEEFRGMVVIEGRLAE
jgi:hypothetical protein